MLRWALYLGVSVGIDIAYFLFLFVSLSSWDGERRMCGELKGSLFFLRVLFERSYIGSLSLSGTYIDAYMLLELTNQFFFFSLEANYAWSSVER